MVAAHIVPAYLINEGELSVEALDEIEGQTRNIIANRSNVHFNFFA